MYAGLFSWRFPIHFKTITQNSLDGEKDFDNVGFLTM